MIVKTRRFGQLTIGEGETIKLPHGVLGFPGNTQYCLVDPGDETLILWLQSIENPDIAFPILEPKIFKPDYSVRLSAAELRDLKLDSINRESAVFAILTIPEDVSQMTANLKAPIVINIQQRVAKQVVLQENEYALKVPMFRELKTHLGTIRAQRQAGTDGATSSAGTAGMAIQISNVPPSLTVRDLSSPAKQF